MRALEALDELALVPDGRQIAAPQLILELGHGPAAHAVVRLRCLGHALCAERPHGHDAKGHWWKIAPVGALRARFDWSDARTFFCPSAQLRVRAAAAAGRLKSAAMLIPPPASAMEHLVARAGAISNHLLHLAPSDMLPHQHQHRVVSLPAAEKPPRPRLHP